MTDIFILAPKCLLTSDLHGTVIHSYYGNYSLYQQDGSVLTHISIFLSTPDHKPYMKVPPRL